MPTSKTLVTPNYEDTFEELNIVKRLHSDKPSTPACSKYFEGRYVPDPVGSAVAQVSGRDPYHLHDIQRMFPGLDLYYRQILHNLSQR